MHIQIILVGYNHIAVNHSYNFVDPVTQVTTNKAESIGQRAKSKFKSMMDPTNRALVPEYLSESM